MLNIYARLLQFLEKDPDLVLATVVATKGSTPQKPGSSAVISRKGLIWGTVGGGVVEGKTIAISLESLESHNPGIITLSLSNSIASKEEAICGGEISLLIDALPAKHLEVFRSICDSLYKRVPGVLITAVTQVAEKISVVDRYWVNSLSDHNLPEGFPGHVMPAITAMLTSGDPGDYTQIELWNPGVQRTSSLFLEPVYPEPALLIAGAGHLGRALTALCSKLGFYCVIIDDREEFANEINIPDADKIIVDKIGNAIRDIEKGDDTYIVIVTRGHSDDAGALQNCIGSGAAYIGMIGSRSKINAMRAEFLEQGWCTRAQWDKIHAPVGLEIHSRTVEEIAISIAAQLVKVRAERRISKNVTVEN